MTAPGKRIRISVGGVHLEAELRKTKTADEVYAVLPVTATISTWGEEFFFPIPGVHDYRETATTKVKIGDIAFWGAGKVLAIFFGRTPMSVGADPVPADRVNIIGSIVGDATRFRQVMDVPTIHLEPG
ncbi:MAG: cyclophilin-like fold protein [Nitrospira sp.]